MLRRSPLLVRHAKHRDVLQSSKRLINSLDDVNAQLSECIRSSHKGVHYLYYAHQNHLQTPSYPGDSFGSGKLDRGRQIHRKKEKKRKTREGEKERALDGVSAKLHSSFSPSIPFFFCSTLTLETKTEIYLAIAPFNIIQKQI